MPTSYSISRCYLILNDKGQIVKVIYGDEDLAKKSSLAGFHVIICEQMHAFEVTEDPK